MVTNIQIIRHCSDRNILRQYAVWLQMKQVFKHSCFYNGNISHIIKTTGLSRNTVKKYINFYIENGWAREHGNNITLISQHKLKKLLKITLMRNINISHLDHSSTSKTITLLNYLLFKFKHDQFQYLREMSSDLINPNGSKALQRHKAAVRFFKESNSKPILDESDDTYNPSVFTIARTINKSIASASRLTKNLADLKLITVKENKKVVSPERKSRSRFNHGTTTKHQTFRKSIPFSRIDQQSVRIFNQSFIIQYRNCYVFN